VIAKEKRTKAFGKQLDKVLAELDSRDLSLVPTDRLKAEAEQLQLGEKTGRIGYEIDLDFEQIDLY